MAAQPSEQDLIQQAQAGDSEAFNQLVLRYQDGLYRYASSLCGDPDLADDITQETFIKAFQNIKAVQTGTFRPWLFKIATNTARDLARRSARHPSIPLYPQDEHGEEVESPYWLLDSSPLVEAALQSNERNAELYRMVDELPEAHRSILTLIDLQEMDYIEAAEILEIPLGTVKSRLARARLQMKRKLQSAHDSSITSHNLQALAI